MATGAVDRLWWPMPWTKVITDSSFLQAKVGPCVLQVMQLVGRLEQNNELYATARLNRDGKLVCGPLSALHANDSPVDEGDDDVIVGEKRYEGGGVTAVFRQKNVRCGMEFRSRALTGRGGHSRRVIAALGGAWLRTHRALTPLAMRAL